MDLNLIYLKLCLSSSHTYFSPLILILLKYIELISICLDIYKIRRSCKVLHPNIKALSLVKLLKLYHALNQKAVFTFILNF